jgi:hypothetical protein
MVTKEGEPGELRIKGDSVFKEFVLKIVFY